MASLASTASRTDVTRRLIPPSVRGQVCWSGSQPRCRPAVQGQYDRLYENPSLSSTASLFTRTPRYTPGVQAQLSSHVSVEAARDDTNGLGLKPLRVLEGVVDDPELANPLARLHRLGTGWFGVIVEYEGVLVDSAEDAHRAAWIELCKREGRSVPPRWMLDRAEGMKNEQVVSEVLCLARQPQAVKRLAAEKEDIFLQICGDRRPKPQPGTIQLIQTLHKHDLLQIPVALASTVPERRVHRELRGAGLSGLLDAIIAAEDVSRGRPDPEAYLAAAAAIQRPPARCIVIGTANTAVEAAHDVGMQCVALAARQRVYELAAADLVARRPDELSVQNLKQLFRAEEGIEPQPELQTDDGNGGRPRASFGFADEPFGGR